MLVEPAVEGKTAANGMKVVPRDAFEELMARSAPFRRFVFAAFTARITNLFRLVEEVAFARMDIRLAHKLVELSHGAPSIAMTQQQLAAELGTAREVAEAIVFLASPQASYITGSILNVSGGRA